MTANLVPHVEGLPVQPQITPALSVAGALLIITGTFYTLVGIKTKWLHIFLSTAYLFSLAVTVLIVYVMHPPVSNAVQGAYFVAAAVTGIIAGALAVVFADVTEGLGCFLGGFCLGMWLLTLKAGGTLTSSAGRAIFIACFTVGTFSLYLSHYTRPYGLIGSTSFAGATVVLLGVDMFSRAGLKEFWLYIWGLNDDVFPFRYEGPYPMTRGIRVEVACTVLLFILGIMSQMKIWKIIKKRREQRATEQLQRDQEQDLAEEDLGRRLNAENDRDMKIWDRIYGNKKHCKDSQATSGTGTEQGSTRKTSCSIVDTREAPGEGMEMANLKSSEGSRKGGGITVHIAQDDDISELPSPSGARSIGSRVEASREPSVHDSQTGGPKSIASETSSLKAPTAIKINNPKAVDSGFTNLPEYVPLPFKVPTDTDYYDNDKSSVATFAASEHVPNRQSHRMSGSSLIRKLSGRSNRKYMGPTLSEEALVVPYYDRSGASSVAATLDGVSVHNLSREALSSEGASPAASDDKPGEKIFAPEELGLAPSAEQTGPDPVGKGKAREAPAVSIAASENLDHNSLDDTVSQIGARSDISQQPTSQPQLAGNLPDSSSKVVMAYRTNEWAKHLDNADQPEVEDIKVTRVKEAARSESPAPAPVNMQALQQTPLSAEPAPAANALSKDDPANLPSSTSNNSYVNKQRSPCLSPSASKTSLSPNPLSRTSSQNSLGSNGSNPETSTQALPKNRTSQSSLAPPARGFRSSSTPMIGSPLASPIQEDEETFFPARFTPSPMHLLSQRNSLMRNKPSSTSLLAQQKPGSTLRRSASANSSQLPLNTEDDNIPLSQRKSLLSQRNSTSSNPYATQPQTRNSSRLSLGQAAPSPQRHAPKAVATWRASLANDATHQNLQTTAEIEDRRAELMAEQSRQRNSVQQAQQARTQRTSVLDREMRRGSMLDAHREAMRKMQGEVKM